jgi:hypothetical protein
MSQRYSDFHPLTHFLNCVKAQRTELLKTMGDFEAKKEKLVQELNDINMQIDVLNTYQDCIDDIEVHISENK